MGWTEAVEAAGSLGVTPEMTPRFLVAVLVAIIALRVLHVAFAPPPRRPSRPTAADDDRPGQRRSHRGDVRAAPRARRGGTPRVITSSRTPTAPRW